MVSRTIARADDGERVEPEMARWRKAPEQRLQCNRVDRNQRRGFVQQPGHEGDSNALGGNTPEPRVRGMGGMTAGATSGRTSCARKLAGYGAGAGATSNSPCAFIAASKRSAGSSVLFHSMTLGNQSSATV